MANGQNGRRPDGTFAPGNSAGRGGDHVSIKRGIEFKDAVMAAVTPEEMRQVARELLSIALTGKDERSRIAAASELFNRIIGKPSELAVGDTHNHFGNILSNSGAEALKHIQQQDSKDPMRGVKCLPNPNGKGKRKARGDSA